MFSVKNTPIYFCAAVIFAALPHSVAGQVLDGSFKEVVTVRPRLSIPVEELKKIAATASMELTATSTPAAKVIADQGSYIPVYVAKDDSLATILEKQWGPAIKNAGVNLEGLTKELRTVKGNRKIADRSTNGLLIWPGDTLYLPAVVGGLQKTGPIYVAAAQIPTDPLNRALVKNELGTVQSNVAENTSAPVTKTKEPFVASLSTDKECTSVHTKPIDLGKVLDQLKIVSSAQVGVSPWTNGVIAVLDTGLNGNLPALTPFMASAPQWQDEQQHVDYGINVPREMGTLESLATNAAPPSRHGTHIMALALGGSEWLTERRKNASLLGAGWKLLPIVIETDNGPPRIEPKDVEEGVVYAKGKRAARIINMSIEAKGQKYLDFIRDPSERRQRLYVVAAGNGNLTYNDKPALDFEEIKYAPDSEHIVPAMLGGWTTSHIISVGAFDSSKKELADFSGRYYQYVDIAAPGICVQSYSKLASPIDNSDLSAFSGTSQSTAIVTFAASLVADIFGQNSFDPPRIKARLLASSIYEPLLKDAVSSRGRLSIERAISARFDILRYKDRSGQEVDAYGEFVKAEGNTVGIDQMYICTSPNVTLRNIWKAVPKGTSKDDAAFDYVRIKVEGLVEGDAKGDPFSWEWKECKALWDNVNRLRFKPIKGDAFDVAFDKIIEIVPRQLRPSIGQ